MTSPSEPTTVRLERLLHTYDNPEGLPYAPPPAKRGRRHHIPWPGRVTERWVCEGGGFIGRGRNIRDAESARRTAALGAS